MRYHNCSLIISLMIHGVFIAAITGLTTFSHPVVHSIAIDFTIDNAPEFFQPEYPIPQSPAPSSEPPHKKVVAQRKPTTPIRKQEVAFPDTSTELPPDNTVVPAEVVSSEINHQPNRIAMNTTMTPQKNIGTSKEERRRHYLKEQFEYIRTRIYHMAIYPPAALEMNITGTVFLSFCVCEDGSVEKIDILRGSGAPILDRDAISTIKRAAPFPHPPVPVVVKFPFEYRLE